MKEAKPGARKVETTMSYLCDEDANNFVTRISIIFAYILKVEKLAESTLHPEKNGGKNAQIMTTIMRQM